MGCLTHIADVIVSIDEVQFDIEDMVAASCSGCSSSGMTKGLRSIVRFVRKMDSLKLPVFLKTGVVRLSEKNVWRSRVTFSTAMLLSSLIVFQPSVPLVSMLGEAIEVSFNGQKTKLV